MKNEKQKTKQKQNKNKKQKNKNKKKQKCGVQERFYGKTIGEYIYIYKFWNFDNRFLVGVKFKFLKLICILHINFVKTLIVTLSKETNKNK